MPGAKRTHCGQGSARTEMVSVPGSLRPGLSAYGNGQRPGLTAASAQRVPKWSERPGLTAARAQRVRHVLGTRSERSLREPRGCGTRRALAAVSPCRSEVYGRNCSALGTSLDGAVATLVAGPI